jgi:hypothetical protein
MVAGASIATAARRTTPHPPSCGAATGATWHVKHWFYKYDQHGALVFDHNGPVRLPASGNRYVIQTGAYCQLAHKWMHRLTSAKPDAGSGGRTIAGFYVPRGEGLLYLADRPPGMVCAATVDQTKPADHNGDNLHLGSCVTQAHKFAFIWSAHTPSPYKYKPK